MSSKNGLEPDRNIFQKLYLALHECTFSRRKRKQVRFPDKRIVSIGNLSTGGTGKTPVVQFLAKHAQNHNTLIVLRGYGGSLAKKGALVSSGDEIFLDWKESGDEALLLAGPQNVRVAVGRDRAGMIRKCGADAELVLLDDAFQNPSVYRDSDLVLIDIPATGNSLRIIPFGHFREGLESLRRATTVLLTRIDQASPELTAEIRRAVEKYVPSDRIFQAVHAPDGLEPAMDPDAKKTMGAFCGIGSPDSFFATAETQGFHLQCKLAFPDHHPYSEADLMRLEKRSRRENLCWLTTAKDMVRIRGRLGALHHLRENLHVLKIQLCLEADREHEFLEQILGDFSDRHRRER